MSGTSHEDEDLFPDTTYTYEVGSVAGGAGPAWSAPLDASTPEFAVPSNFAARALGPDSVEVSWDPAPGDGVVYKVRHRVSGTRRWTTQDFTESPGTVGNLEPLTDYDFRILANRRSSSGTVHRTEAADTEVTTPAPDPPRLEVDATLANAVELSWTSVPGATEYELQRRSPPGTGTWETVYGPDSDTSYRDEEVTAGTGHGYQVRAVISNRGETRWSAEQEAATPAAALPAVPENLAAEAESSSVIRLTWTAVENVTRYRVQRRPEGGSGDDWEAVAAVEPSDSPSYRDSGRSADSGYDYRVRSELEVGGQTLRSDWTEHVSVRTQP